MPRRQPDGQILALAMRFTADLERLVDTRVRERFAAEIQRQLARLLGKPLDGAPVPAAPGRRTRASKPAASSKRRPRTNELKRLAAIKPVVCPVGGCKNPGVRAFANFCREHNAELDKAEKRKLRDAQRKSAGAVA